MDKILHGVLKFQSSVAPDKMPLFAKLVKEGQAPRCLFITCADSRIVPDMITSTDPGDLFIIRNIGNLVPPFETLASGGDHSVGAALEYALTVLKIPNIVICGHSDCGAMKAVRDYKKLPDGTALKSWLCNAAESVDNLQRGRILDPELSPQNQLAQLNVLQQLRHLKTYPVVQEKLESGAVQIHAWYLEIENARVDIFHPGRNRFVLLDEVSVQEVQFLNSMFRTAPAVKMDLDRAMGL